jgi:hypothetical protein
MMTISTFPALVSNGIASPIARAAWRLPSQHTMTLSRLIEPVDRGLGVGFVIGLLPLDNFGGNIAGGGNRHDRVVNERDAGQMRVHGAGDGDRVIADGSAAPGHTQIDDNILDHETSPGARSAVTAILSPPSTA